MDWLSPIKQIFELVLPFLERLSVIRAILGFILVFFKRINVVERIALSFGLSIALVTLSILALNVLLGIRIASLNSFLIIIVLTIIPVVIYYLKRMREFH